MKLTFTHQGVERTLVKHPRVQKAVASGSMSPEQAAFQPWYLRYTPPGGTKQSVCLKTFNDKDAIKAAKEELNGITQAPVGYAAYLQEKSAKRSTTIGDLATEWKTAGLPFRKTEAREPDAAARLKATIDRALPWWEKKPVATVNPSVIEDYADHRKPAFRSADLELAALSSLCQWAVLTGKIEKNPFEKRARFAEVKQHCHEACPESDDVLHQLLGYCFEAVTDAHHQKSLLKTRLAAGTLAFCALTGLRPGEPAFLMRVPVLPETPTNTRELVPGTLFRDRQDTLRMKVQRLKNGQNPFVTIHAAAESFLSAWRAWLAANLPDEEHLFPLGTDDQTTLNRALNRASDFLKLPHFKPHAMRAFYVKVRRSQGEDDATIAGELGQTTNGQLIRDVYGDPQDLIGGQLFDWLPDKGEPSWSLLARLPKLTASKPNSAVLA